MARTSGLSSAQAITAIRLLLRSGEARSVLLVCPKPLVTNWQREFALWAPELPLSVIEGDQEKRRWHWQLPEAPIKIANYEALNRDRRLVVETVLEVTRAGSLFKASESGRYPPSPLSGTPRTVGNGHMRRC